VGGAPASCGAEQPSEQATTDAPQSIASNVRGDEAPEASRQAKPADADTTTDPIPQRTDPPRSVAPWQLRTPAPPCPIYETDAAARRMVQPRPDATA